MNVTFKNFLDEDKKIAQFVLNEFSAMFADNRNHVLDLYITIDPTKPYPRTCPKRLNPQQTEDYIIYLNLGPLYWCQLIYQLAHELGHFYMDCYPEIKNYKWLSEVLCEVFSNVFLEKSFKFFNSYCPIYINDAQKYLNDHLKPSQLRKDTCSEFVSQNIKDLENDPTEDGVEGRPRNCFIAYHIYQAISGNYAGLTAVRLFPQISQPKSLKDFFIKWNKLSETDDERCFIKTLQTTLGC